MKCKTITLGQMILEVSVPDDMLNEIRMVYKQEGDKLKKANAQLAGKIKREFQLYYYYGDTLNNVLSEKFLNWYKFQFRTYLIMNKIQTMTIRLSSIWINEMYANEYNPVHIHKSNTPANREGLSSVMIIKLPESYGKEYSRDDDPHNGQLQFISSGGGQFSRGTYYPKVKVGDLYIFPYDLRHCVYPFNTTKDSRITVAANCDVIFDKYEKE